MMGEEEKLETLYPCYGDIEEVAKLTAEVNSTIEISSAGFLGAVLGAKRGLAGALRF